MPTELCRHIRTNGTRCRSLALRGGPFCFYHGRMASLHRVPDLPLDATETVLHPVAPSDRSQRDPQLARCLPQLAPPTFDLPPLEDRESIQLAVSMIVAAMARGRIDLKLATGLLYGLQIASCNAARMVSAPEPEDIVRDTVIGDDGRQIALDVDPHREPGEEDVLDRILRNLRESPAPEPPQDTPGDSQPLTIQAQVAESHAWKGTSFSSYRMCPVSKGASAPEGAGVGRAGRSPTLSTATLHPFIPRTPATLYTHSHDLSDASPRSRSRPRRHRRIGASPVQGARYP